MTLSPELQQAAQEFGAALHQHGMIQHYLQAVAALAADPEASLLDQRFESIRADLIARQRAGEDLPSDEVQTFYALRDEVAGHPLIEKRDSALTMAKGYLANVGMDLNQTLGLDFVTIASS
jgi:cell fate (sporulation/competence/biofilm development) regulator YlbF (YheA/YmcA/DUF963 family)